MERNKNITDKTSIEKGREMLKKALSESARQEFEEIEENDELIDYEFSDNFKRKMNKIFCEFVGPDRIPYPEVEES